MNCLNNLANLKLKMEDLIYRNQLEFSNVIVFCSTAYDSLLSKFLMIEGLYILLDFKIPA